MQNIFIYQQAAPNEGLYYWRTTQRSDRPLGIIPKHIHDNNYEPHKREKNDPTDVRATVDSDYTGDKHHRQSFTGITIKMAGAAIYYKTTFQAIVALSSTEAEFIAACEAAKVILYVHSILEDMG